MPTKGQKFNKYSSEEERIAARKEQNRINALKYYHRNREVVLEKQKIYKKNKKGMDDSKEENDESLKIEKKND